MNFRRIRHLVVHTPRQLLARASGWEHLLRRHAELLRNVGIAVALLVAATITILLITNADDARPTITPPAITATTTTPAPASTQPTPTPGPRPKPEPPTEAEVTSYIVRRGDTLATIALRHNVPFEQLAADSGIVDVNRVRPGQRLSVRPPAASVQVIRPGATLSSYARQTGLSVAALTALNPQITDPDRIQAGGMLRLSGLVTR